MNLHKYAQYSNETRLPVMIRSIKFEANLKMSTEATINNACIFRWLFANVKKKFSIFNLNFMDIFMDIRNYRYYLLRIINEDWK